VDTAGLRVEVEVAVKEGTVWGVEDGIRAHVHGYERRQWRHLDTMQCETVVVAEVPRLKWKGKNGKERTEMVTVPWARKSSRWTVWFEAWAVQVLQAAANLQRACELLRLEWKQAQRLMELAVERGLEKRELEQIRYCGMDEKSFGKGQSYISLLTDLEGGRVLEVMEGRSEEAADFLWDTLSEEQRERVEAVAIDMAPAYLSSVRYKVPGAAVVHDKFHVAKHLGEAVDKVRRDEHKSLMAKGDDRLKGSRQLWLYAKENVPEGRKSEFGRLRRSELKVARAWTLKEMFRHFWGYHNTGAAENFFARWFGWARRSQLKPIKEVALMLKRHLDNLLTSMRHPITNAVTEGLNSKIQGLKNNARGFRSFLNYRTRILFHCGKLDLMPVLP
jgi:transposase